MSLHEYLCGLAIGAEGPSFYALLFAMILKADSDNFEKIQRCWPEKCAEMRARLTAPGGALPGDGDCSDIVVEASVTVEWVCAVCEERNSLGVNVCADCDTERGRG